MVPRRHDQTTWTEDRATQRCDPSAVQGPRPKAGRRSLPPAFTPLRDRHQSEKPSRHDAATSSAGCPSPLANVDRPKFQFTLNQDREVMTPYRVYDLFVNGCHFHTDEDCYEILSFRGDVGPRGFAVNPFLEHWFHWTTCHLAFAALGLDRYIQNGCTFANLPLLGVGIERPTVVIEFLLNRKRMAEMNQQYQTFSNWIEQHGSIDNCRWK